MTTAATPDATTTFHQDALGQVNMTVQSVAADSSMVQAFGLAVRARRVGPRALVLHAQRHSKQAKRLER